MWCESGNLKFDDVTRAFSDTVQIYHIYVISVRVND